MNNPPVKIIVQNRRAHHDYFIEDSYECGIVLKGTEIKSIRSGKVNLQDAYSAVKNGEMLIYNMHISPYEKGNIFNHVPNQTRKLLLHKKEIVRLSSKVQKEGYTLIPLALYLVGGLAKIKLGLAKGKKLQDKRETLKEKAMNQEIRKQGNPKYQE
ncbi:MAG TPA: SsrA-binding protein SmpB [Bacilli bacterium]|nr:SsrA-binding protein SmpB [Bacilli bacterium]